jgi:DNA-binding MarR family transcriptional regulator
VLLVLWEHDGLSVSQLGERLSLDSGTLTPLLKRLQAQGLLQRRRDAADERRVRVDLTAAGRALRDQALAVPQAIACASACDLPQIGALASQLHGLRRQLQATPPSAGPPLAAARAPFPSTAVATAALPATTTDTTKD